MLITTVITVWTGECYVRITHYLSILHVYYLLRWNINYKYIFIFSFYSEDDVKDDLVISQGSSQQKMQK